MLPMLPSVTTAMVTGPRELGAAYWRRNLESPVLFADAVSNLLKADKAHILLEIGPHSALSGPLKQIFRSHSLKHGPLYIPTLKRCDDTSFDASCEVQLLSALGLIHSNGAIVDPMSVNGRGQVVTDLPPYPWQPGTRYWNESRLVRDWRLSSMPPHELLGSRCPESTDLVPSWRNIVGTGSNPWLADHILRGHVVFPAAGYIAMAGEAVRQLNPGTEGFAAKDVLFKSPLVINETGSVEIITSLKPVAFNDVMNSEWYSFVIASHDGSVWTEICSGQVRAGAEHEPCQIKIPRYARQLSSEKWYEALSELGLSYGPQFRGLQNISADPLGGRASASVNLVKQHESHYFVHPTMLDQCLQLMSVAGAAGLRRRIIKNAIPSSIEHLLVRSVGEYMDVNVEVKQETGTFLAGDATAMFEDKVVLFMKRGMHFSHGNEGNTNPIPLVAQVQWKPDIDFQPPHGLIPSSQMCESLVNTLGKTNTIAGMYILQTVEKIKHIQPQASHLAKWKDWLLAKEANIRNYAQILGSYRDRWALMSTVEKEAIIEDLRSELVHEEDPMVPVVCMEQIYTKCEDIMADKFTALDLLLNNNLMGQYYAWGQKYVDWSHFLTLLCHSKSGLRILEIGGGTGAATAAALRSLYNWGVPMYSRYIFTDIAPNFLEKARSRFGSYKNMQYETLDISREPLEQGFAESTFDLIIASNVRLLWMKELGIANILCRSSVQLQA